MFPGRIQIFICLSNHLSIQEELLPITNVFVVKEKGIQRGLWKVMNPGIAPGRRLFKLKKITPDFSVVVQSLTIIGFYQLVIASVNN